MNTNILIRFLNYIPIGMLALLLMGCERDLEDLSPVTNSTNPLVFIDDFSAGLNYAAFGGSIPTAFDVDNKVTYNNSSASMRFDVPNANDPNGLYAGGVFFTESGRDLSGFTALTFWAKASQSAILNVVGFGNDLGASKYQTSISDLAISTAWQKYYIPVPDPSRLTNERGMFFYSVAPIEGKGFSFWIDELKFENPGTIAHPQFTILNGEDQTETAFIGVEKAIGGLTSIFNLPNGINQAVNITPAYFEFTSSDTTIAKVDATGRVMVTGGPGNAEITASVRDVIAEGSLMVQSEGAFENAPVPTLDPSNVISIFSDIYPNVPVEYYNGYWAPYQTTLSADFEVGGDHILHYTDFNFVGIEFSAPTIDATSMTHLYMDIFIPNQLSANAKMKFEIVDDAGGGTGAFFKDIPVSMSQQWVRIDMPFEDIAGLNSRAALMQIIFVNESGNISNFYADNILFYNDGTPPPPLEEPETQAPTPTHPAANVIAIYSDSYEVLPGTDYPDWGQLTVVSEVQIQGNNTLKFAGLNYQGIQLGSSQNVSAMNFLHLDFWTANSTLLKVWLISPGPVEKEFSLTVPTTGWASIDIPMSAFAPVNLSDVIQLKFDGNGDIWLDNIYFRKN
ncbi:MAG: glycosyl hydrolase family 16 [Bacteroidales bacterium]|nr:glycosyl hydrolase family 16 [Bacteroidales bacterium]